MIAVQLPYVGWRMVSRGHARSVVRTLMDHLTTIPPGHRAAYIERHYLRGITVAELLEGEE